MVDVVDIIIRVGGGQRNEGGRADNYGIIVISITGWGRGRGCISVGHLLTTISSSSYTPGIQDLYQDFNILSITCGEPLFHPDGIGGGGARKLAKLMGMEVSVEIIPGYIACTSMLNVVN